MHNTYLPMSAHWLKEIESKTEITGERESGANEFSKQKLKHYFLLRHLFHCCARQRMNIFLLKTRNLDMCKSRKKEAVWELEFNLNRWENTFRKRFYTIQWEKFMQFLSEREQQSTVISYASLDVWIFFINSFQCKLLVLLSCDKFKVK